MFFENVRNPHTFVRYWYEIRDILVHDLKFTKCEIYGSTEPSRFSIIMCFFFKYQFSGCGKPPCHSIFICSCLCLDFFAFCDEEKKLLYLICHFSA